MSSLQIFRSSEDSSEVNHGTSAAVIPSVASRSRNRPYQRLRYSKRKISTIRPTTNPRPIETKESRRKIAADSVEPAARKSTRKTTGRGSVIRITESHGNQLNNCATLSSPWFSFPGAFSSMFSLDASFDRELSPILAAKSWVHQHT